ncbi:hypothetical protein [Herbaspirillum rubrisubalbicans]|uniref:Uncharacterized protein n=1 Tax=Herbaspirillum rubrisubalbicans TaxID=80842 RepID=A0AAD0UEY7_9BURK|nr:hypothetical protein [Herbaspirillum rubrisubalbicans]AYR25749.1 hypothetical protein RC54_18890 [Herbaspirillum rubrisubalbicans]
MAKLQLEDKSVKEFVFEFPLYAPLSGNALQIGGFIQEMRSGETMRFDSYCPNCCQDTTWVRAEDPFLDHVNAELTGMQLAFGRADDLSRVWIDNSRHYAVTYQCSRVLEHHFHAYFAVSSNPTSGNYEIVKCGQIPSLLSMKKPLKAHEALLDKEARSEFREALLLSAHGNNIAAFLHLRRILEKLVDIAAVEKGREDPSFDAVAYSRGSFGEKVGLVKDRVPEFLNNTPQLYSILSEGLHQWSNERCGAVIDLMELAIDLILKKVAEEKLRKSEEERTRIALQKLASQMPARPT